MRSLRRITSLHFDIHIKDLKRRINIPSVEKKTNGEGSERKREREKENLMLAGVRGMASGKTEAGVGTVENAPEAKEGEGELIRLVEDADSAREGLIEAVLPSPRGRL